MDMARNVTLIRKCRQIVEMDDIANRLLDVGSRIVDDGMNRDVMVNASHLEDIMVTMCSELRRLCAEPYGDVP
jgi:hypothetical protein